MKAVQCNCWQMCLLCISYIRIIICYSADAFIQSDSQLTRLSRGQSPPGAMQGYGPRSRSQQLCGSNHGYVWLEPPTFHVPVMYCTIVPLKMYIKKIIGVWSYLLCARTSYVSPQPWWACQACKGSFWRQKSYPCFPFKKEQYITSNVFARGLRHWHWTGFDKVASQWFTKQGHGVA